MPAISSNQEDKAGGFQFLGHPSQCNGAFLKVRKKNTLVTYHFKTGNYFLILNYVSLL